MKKFSMLFLFTVMLALVTGCGTGDKPAEAEAQKLVDAMAREDYHTTVGILTEGAENPEAPYLEEILADTRVEIKEVGEDTITFQVTAPDFGDLFANFPKQAKNAEDFTMDALDQYLKEQMEEAERNQTDVKVRYEETDGRVQIHYLEETFCNAVTGGSLPAYGALFEEVTGEVFRYEPRAYYNGFDRTVLKEWLARFEKEPQVEATEASSAPGKKRADAFWLTKGGDGNCSGEEMIRLDLDPDGTLGYCNYQDDGSSAAPLCEGRAAYQMNDSEITITGIRLAEGEPEQTVRLTIVKESPNGFRLALKSGTPKTKTEQNLTTGSYYVYDEKGMSERLRGDLGIPEDFDGTFRKGTPEYWFAGGIFTVFCQYQKDGKTVAEAGADCYSGEAVRSVFPYQEEP